jgi:1-acyl-sn-glycerol-3-phosphate acyltransferase
VAKILAPIQTVFVYLWLFGACLIGLLITVFRWKDPNLNRDIGKLYGVPALWMARIRLRVENAERLEDHQPCIYIANHQSGLDVATFGSNLPHNTLGIGKIELLWIPFFGAFYWAAGNIMIRRQNRAHAHSGISQAAQEVRERGVSVFVFPEGTRNRGEGLLPFKKGAFHLAIEAQVPVVPLVLSPLKKIDGPREVVIRVLEPIPTQGLKRENLDALVREARERMLVAFHSLSDRP